MVSNVTSRDPLANTTALRAWLAGNAELLREFAPRPSDSLDERIRRDGTLLATLDEAGYGGLGWASEFGGRGGDARARADVYDALTQAGLDLPEHVAALEVIAPTLIVAAPHLATACLPSILRGEAVWCQGFSEPEAGSDLAALKTRAETVPGGFAVSGQKVWTSLGHHAAWCALLVRTGSQPRHRGLTLLWVDLSSPGVTVRPLRTLNGHEEYSEIFLDDVFVPEDHVIGAVDGGWAMVLSMLQYERAMWAWQRQTRMHAALDRMVSPASAQDLDEGALGEAYLMAASVRLRSRRSVIRLAAGETLGAETSVDKILLSTAEQAVRDLVLESGPEWFSWSDEPGAEDARGEWFYSRAASVYGGAVEIQRNLVAELILGLPKDPSRG